VVSALRRHRGAIFVNGLLAAICLLWLLPAVGLAVSSFRTRDAILDSGWWSIVPHQEWATVDRRPIPSDVGDSAVVIEGVRGTFDELRAGVVTDDGQRVVWLGNRRAGRIEIQERGWVADLDFTLENYGFVLTGKQYEFTDADDNTTVQRGKDFETAMLNTIVVTIPSTVIPMTIAAFAAYGFAWLRFRGRTVLFALLVALLVVPLQIALVPILRDYAQVGLNGTFLGLWLAHTGFGIPIAVFIMFNYMRQLPREIIESARVDGASHFTIFVRLIVPLSVPVLASYAIFQFLWVWNDYLVALIFIGNRPDTQVLTMRLAELVGTFGNDWHLLTSGAIVSMLGPLAVFFALQRYFVRGLLGGSLKG
jgi:alpha-glucoside transport system permease protein